MPTEERDLSIGQAMDLGVQMAVAGQHQNATAMFRGVLIHEPMNFEAMERLGSSLFELKEYHEALYWFWRGLKIDRKHPMGLTNYGLCLSQIGHPDEGVAFIERAAIRAEKVGASNAVKALAYNNLGNTYERLLRHADALTALDKGLSYDPTDPFPHYNRGIALMRLNRHREAVEALTQSIDLRRAPGDESASRLNDADAHYNLGIARLLLGDIERGFADYEYRLLTTTTRSETPNLNLPAELKWDGTITPGMRLMVHCEQGLGDDIQFFRFLPELVRRGANVIVLPHKATAPFARMIEGVTVPEMGTSIEGIYDRWAALMSLPFYLGVKTEADIPPPFFPAIEPERIERWEAQLPPRGPMRIGVCWAGQFMHKNNEHRSIPLKKFSAIFDASGCNFISVQQISSGETEEMAALQAAKPNVSALWFNDFRDTAAAMMSLDLMVCVDTSVAHLSASLGIPTWILIPAYSTDWRWQLQRIDTPWYPSASLFRQKKIGEWGATLEHVKAEIETEAHRRATARNAQVFPEHGQMALAG